MQNEEKRNDLNGTLLEGFLAKQCENILGSIVIVKRELNNVCDIELFDN